MQDILKRTIQWWVFTDGCHWESETSQLLEQTQQLKEGGNEGWAERDEVARQCHEQSGIMSRVDLAGKWAK